jgi:tRNA pseudouridine(55) synthase
MILTSMHLLYKKQGETCLEAIQGLKNDQRAKGEPVTLSMTYAGRLDPLAAGLLIVLEGQDEIADKAKYVDLPKTYVFEVVFGISTDTFDQLGIIVLSKEVLSWPTLRFAQDFDKLDIEKGNFKKLTGKVSQTYPFYSSKPIDGVPLFQYVKDHGITATIPKLPTNEVEIYDIEVLEGDMVEETITQRDSLKTIIGREAIEFAELIKGDFRQDEIIESWKNFSKVNDKESDGENLTTSLYSMKFRMTVSSGFYIRNFACWLGQIAGTGAIARNIVRTKIGDFMLL